MAKRGKKIILILIIISSVLIIGGIALYFLLKEKNNKQNYSNNSLINRAVIVEPREHQALEIVLKNISEKIKTPITIVHGTKNKKFVEKIIKKIPEVDIITEINAENLDAKTYSKMITNLEFWENIGVDENDHILLFQTDSGICGSGYDIHKVSKYDYCGAPWTSRENNRNVGNGGFSIRSVAHAKKHIKQYGSFTINEDMMFSKWCYQDKDCNVCPSTVAHQFCNETFSEKSTAFHNNWKYHNVISCDLNQKIKDLNISQPSTSWPVPNVLSWEPKFIMRYNRQINSKNVLTHDDR